MVPKDNIPSPPPPLEKLASTCYIFSQGDFQQLQPRNW